VIKILSPPTPLRQQPSGHREFIRYRGTVAVKHGCKLDIAQLLANGPPLAMTTMSVQPAQCLNKVARPEQGSTHRTSPPTAPIAILRQSSGPHLRRAFQRAHQWSSCRRCDAIAKLQWRETSGCGLPNRHAGAGRHPRQTNTPGLVAGGRGRHRDDGAGPFMH
jgi:hypothetical protein